MHTSRVLIPPRRGQNNQFCAVSFGDYGTPYVVCSGLPCSKALVMAQDLVHMVRAPALTMTLWSRCHSLGIPLTHRLPYDHLPACTFMLTQNLHMGTFIPACLDYMNCVWCSVQVCRQTEGMTMCLCLLSA